MGKFKVGDRVVGNEKANRYGITVEGWEGTVTRVGNGYISVNGPGSCGGVGFSVDPDCFDLLQPAPNSHLDEHISIFARKNRIVATITKGDQKFTQSVSLHKTNGDFKTAVKMVVEKLLDRFEAREQAPLTATDFKVGDRVEHKKYGKGTIIGFCGHDKSPGIGVEFDNLLGIGHDLNLGNCPKCKKGHGWFCHASELKLVETAVKESSFDWEAFKAGKFAVHCDTEEKAEAFLKECDGVGIKWFTGTRTVDQKETRWKVYKSRTSYGCDSFGRLMFGTFDSQEIIDYTPSKPAVKEVKRPAKIGEWIRVTSTDGHSNGLGIFKVTGLSKVHNDWVYVNGKSSGIIRGDQYVVLENYQPEDKSIDSNPELEQPISSASMREVKREAKAGEYVKVVNARNVPVLNGKPEYQNGDILKILNSNCGQATYAEGKAENGRYRVLNTHEYVVLENFDYSVFPKNEPWRKAKVGDKIKVVRDIGGHGPEVIIGDVHLVTRMTLSCDGVWTDKRNVFLDKDQEYIIIEEAPEAIQIGDTVKVVNYGHTCDTYRDFIKKYAKGFYHKYAHGYTPNNGDIGVVVGKGKHERYVNKDYYVVLANDKVFCISEEGIEKVK